MKHINKLLALGLAILFMVVVCFACQHQTTTPESTDVQVLDSAQVEMVLANAVKVEEMGKPMVTKNDNWVLTTKYFKVTVALDKDNHIIENPNGDQNQNMARRTGNGTAVVSIGCEFSCQRHEDSEGCALGGCESDQHGHCSIASCGTCITTLKCRPIKSGFGFGGSRIMF